MTPPISLGLADLLRELAAPRTPQEAGLPPHRASLLAAELESTVVDRPSMLAYLRFVREDLGHVGVEETDVVGPALDAVLKDGLTTLPPADLCRLALDPPGLLALRDAVFDELPPYWWARVKETAGRTRPLVTGGVFLSRVLRLQPSGVAPPTGPTIPSGDPAIPVAAFSRPDTDPAVAAGTRRPETWVVAVPPAAIERLPPADLPGGLLSVELTLSPGDDTDRLEVWLDPLRLTSAARCHARLVGRDGFLLGSAEPRDRKLTFSVRADDLTGAVFECEYQRDEVGLRFRVLVRDG